MFPEEYVHPWETAHSPRVLQTLVAHFLRFFLIQPRSINCSVIVNQRMTHTQWLAWVTAHLQKPSVIAKFRANLKTDIRRVGEIFDTNIRFVKVTKVVYFILDIQWDRISHLSHTV